MTPLFWEGKSWSLMTMADIFRGYYYDPLDPKKAQKQILLWREIFTSDSCCQHQDSNLPSIESWIWSPAPYPFGHGVCKAAPKNSNETMKQDIFCMYLLTCILYETLNFGRNKIIAISHFFHKTFLVSTFWRSSRSQYLKLGINAILKNFCLRPLCPCGQTVNALAFGSKGPGSIPVKTGSE